MDPDFSLEEVDSNSLYLDTLPPATRKTLLHIAESDIVSPPDWYLAGGTALALQAGHRTSVDLDFFTERKDFNVDALEEKLVATGSWKTNLIQDNTLYGELMQAKMSFIAYPFFVPSKVQLRFGSIRILPMRDIAAMKVIAVSQRGRKRDFVDLYWYCTHQESLGDAIKHALDQYPQHHLSLSHIFKSLVYFDDAEDDPMPSLNFDATWPEVRGYFEREIPLLAKQMLGL